MNRLKEVRVKLPSRSSVGVHPSSQSSFSPHRSGRRLGDLAALGMTETRSPSHEPSEVQYTTYKHSLAYSHFALVVRLSQIALCTKIIVPGPLSPSLPPISL